MNSKINRKKFLRLVSMATLGIPSLTFTACETRKKSNESRDKTLAVEPEMHKFGDHLGLQLYTVRDYFLDNPEETLKKVAEIGYKELEFFETQMLSQYVPVVNDLGMRVVSTHFLPGYITNKWNEANQMGINKADNYSIDHIIEDCARSQVDYMGIAILFNEERTSLDDYKLLADRANEVGEKSKAAGVQLYYHNHSFEFEPMEGTTPLEAMINIFDPDLVKLELDVFWTTISGNDPSSWIKKLSGQVVFLHLKDLKPGVPQDYTTFDVSEEAFQAVGDGIIDFEKVLTSAQETGVKNTFVEQDHSPIDIFESIARSYQYIQKVNL